MRNNKLLSVLVLLSLTASFAVWVLADSNTPLGAESVTVVQSESANFSLYTPSNTTAEAGNLTELTITGVSQTKAWTGFYGNVSGTIILEDAQGNRFYDWTAAEPKGEIYASVNSSITWTTVTCAPTITNASGYLDQWNGVYGMNSNDYDQINATYNLTNHPTFYVGTLTQTGCPTTYTFVNDVRQFSDFASVLLTSNETTNASTLIFTAILENDTVGVRSGIIGFDGANHDFQILVGEDGHNGNDVLTTYYFWVELQ